MTRFDGDLKTVEHLSTTSPTSATTCPAGPRRARHRRGRRPRRALGSRLRRAVGDRGGDQQEHHPDGQRPVRGFHRPSRSDPARALRQRRSAKLRRALAATASALIQISLIDTWAATAAGAFVLGENSLYTVEAWTTFLNHLTDDGILSVSRWYFRERPAELYRTTALAVEALRAVGVTEPRRHIAIVAQHAAADPLLDIRRVARRRRHHSRQPAARSPMPSSTPWTRETSRLKFDVPFSPRVATDETFTRLTDRPRPRGVPRRLSDQHQRRRPTTARSSSTCCGCATSAACRC